MSQGPQPVSAFGAHPEALSAGPAEIVPTIDDYAVIGDCCTVALVARTGAIEWLCLPNVSSPSVFGAILDRNRAGQFIVRPETPFESERCYLPDTAILETIYQTGSGRARVLDFMSIGEGDRRWAARLRPQRELIRIIEGLEGSVDFAVTVDPRLDYGRRRTSVARRGGFGWVYSWPGALMTIRADFDLAPLEDGSRLAGRVRIEAGASRTVSLGFTQRDVAVQPAVGRGARAELDDAAAWWRRWMEQCSYDGPCRHLVVRSAITLKLLTYTLSGAVVAAATTSLPEAIGAGRNWDYRFCWLRDASTTMHAFLGLGFQTEAGAFLGWLLDATRLTRPELRILYDLHGRNDATETTLDHLDGYRGSRPVRIGNAAGSQLQLDTYGSVILAACEFIGAKGTLRGGEMRLLRDFGETICRRWQEPDHGLWEVRGEPRHFTATKVMCWVALDRLIGLAEEGRVRIPLDRFRANRDAIADAIEQEGYSKELGAYVAEFGTGRTGAPDAAVLLMGTVGYGDPGRDRLRSTLSWLERELGRGGLYARYPAGFDGDRSREGTFGICATWAIELMALQGDAAGARRSLDRLAETANDVGLFAEEYDTDASASLGNFPQAFTHAGFIAAALAVQRVERPLR